MTFSETLFFYYLVFERESERGRAAVGGVVENLKQTLLSAEPEGGLDIMMLRS